MFHDEVFDDIDYTSKNDPNLTDGAKSFLHMLTLRKPQVFYFNADDLDPELAKTGAEFFDQGVIDMPYDRVMYCVDVPMGDGKHERVGLIYMKSPRDPSTKYMFLTLTRQRSEFLFKVKDEQMLSLYNGESLEMGVVLIEKGKQHLVQENERALVIQIVDLLRTFFGATMLLNTKYAEHERVPISEKLNKKREKKGRPTLQPYTLIRLKALRSSGDGTGTHARPRPHWRRGHIRRYADGHITPIAPILVNADLGEAAQKVYKVKGERNAQKITPSGDAGAHQEGETMEGPYQENGPDTRELCSAE